MTDGNEYVHTINTGSNSFDMVVYHYGDARGTKKQFEKSDPSTMQQLIDQNAATSTYASGELATSLDSIRRNLAACWEGENADKATGVITTLTSDAETIARNTSHVYTAFTGFQSQWSYCKQYASGLYEGVLGGGAGEDNSGAHYVFKHFMDSMSTSMHHMPNQLQYHEPLSDQTSPKDTQIPGGVSPGPGPGPGGIGPGPGNIGPGNIGPGPGHIPPPHFPHGPGPGGPGPGGPGPGGIGPGGYGPGGIGPGGIGPGGIGPGGIGPGGGHIPTIDDGSTLAGVGPGPGGGLGPGGASGLGPGAAPGFGPGGGDLAGANGAAGPGGYGPGGGAGEAGGTAGPGRGMMMPMHGNQGSNEERERTTWLAEDDDVWGGDDAPPGVIS